MPSKRKSESFSLLLKPASADCNLSCDYCFYLDKCALYPGEVKHRMDDRILRRVISSYLSTRQPTYSFGWQGGEPTLMGAEFFKKATRLQQEHGRPGSVISNGLQTNGTLLDEEMAEHFREYRFLLGVSIDGPEELHDVYRKRKDGSGTYRQVIRGIELLQKHGVDFNALVLVSRANVTRASAVYRHLKRLGIYHHQYIPCVEYDNKGNLLPWSITGGEWGMFLNTLFDRWFSGDVERVSVRNFDAVLQLMVNRQEVMCTMGRNCRNYFVVEYSGDVYPCDFYVETHLKLGNIMEVEWETMRSSKRYVRFGRKKSELPGECRECQYALYCAGDCMKHRVNGNGGAKGVSHLCEGWKEFYRHSLPVFQMIAQTLRERRP